MITPATAAIRPPTIMARISRSVGLGTPPARQAAATTPVKAPTLMKPAWPRHNSPEMPTTRFRETAMTM